MYRGYILHVSSDKCVSPKFHCNLSALKLHWVMMCHLGSWAEMPWVNTAIKHSTDLHFVIICVWKRNLLELRKTVSPIQRLLINHLDAKYQPSVGHRKRTQQVSCCYKKKLHCCYSPMPPLFKCFHHVYVRVFWGSCYPKHFTLLLSKRVRWWHLIKNGLNKKIVVPWMATWWWLQNCINPQRWQFQRCEIYSFTGEITCIESLVICVLNVRPCKFTMS